MNKYIVVGRVIWDLIIVHAEEMKITDAGIIFYNSFGSYKGYHIVLHLSPIAYTSVQQMTEEEYNARDKTIKELH